MARYCIILSIVLFYCLYLFTTVVASPEAREPGWQRDVVRQMFNSTALGRKILRTHDIYNPDICSWSEITCDLNLRITRLETSTVYFSYSIPEPIGQLTSLEYLRLTDGIEDLQVTIPSAIDDLKNLRYLKLGYLLSGTIPSSIENFKNLEELDLSVNRLTGTIPSGLGLNQPQLRRIFLSGNQITGSIPDEFVRRSFKLLDFSANQLTGSVPPVIYESGIEVLILYDNLLTIFEETIPRPPKLQGCNMAKNPFVCPIPQWAIDECGATCTVIEPLASNDGLSDTTVAIIIASVCLFAIVIVALALFFSRRKHTN